MVGMKVAVSIQETAENDKFQVAHLLQFLPNFSAFCAILSKVGNKKKYWRQQTCVKKQLKLKKQL